MPYLVQGKCAMAIVNLKTIGVVEKSKKKNVEKTDYKIGLCETCLRNC